MAPWTHLVGILLYGMMLMLRLFDTFQLRSWRLWIGRTLRGESAETDPAIPLNLMYQNAHDPHDANREPIHASHACTPRKALDHIPHDVDVPVDECDVQATYARHLQPNEDVGPVETAHMYDERVLELDAKEHTLREQERDIRDRERKHAALVRLFDAEKREQAELIAGCQRAIYALRRL